MAAPVPLREEKLVNEKVIALCEKLLADAQAGRLMGILAVTSTRDKWYEYSRVGVEQLEAIGLHHRAAYTLHKEWDRS